MTWNDQNATPSGMRLPNLIRPHQIPAMVVNADHLSGDTVSLSID
jgi:hypothetical protein